MKTSSRVSVPLWHNLQHFTPETKAWGQKKRRRREGLVKPMSGEVSQVMDNGSKWKHSFKSLPIV